MVTPVSLKIIEEFVAALDHEVAPPAYIFDNLEETLPGPASRRAPAASKSAELLISIPKVNIHSLQNVTFPEDQTFLTEEGSRIRTRYDLADTMVSPADVVIEGFILRSFQRMASRSATGELLPGSLLPDMDLTELKTDFRLSKVKLNLRFADAFKETGLFGIPATKHHFNDPEDTYSAILEEFPIVLDAYIANPRLVVSYDRLATDKPNKFDCSVGDITVTAINQTVEIVFGAAFSWLTFVGDLEAIIAGYHARSLRQSQILLAAIASCSGPPPRVSDPLFVSQPSALWSLGYRPFQNTPAWRLLHRLRYRMKLCSAVDLERRRTELSDLNSRELWTSLVARLADGQLLTESIMAANPLLASVFPHDAAGTALAQEPSHSRLTLMSVDSMGAQVSLRRVGLLIYEYQTEDNAVVLGPVELCLQVTNPGALTTTSAMSSGPSSQSGIMVKCHGTMDRVGVSLNPNLLAFSKHVLRVYRWFLFRGKPWESSDVARGSGTIIEHTIGPPAPFGPAIGRVNVYGAFRIGSISVKASAHNVLAQLRIASTLASITHSVELGAVGNAFSLGMDATGSPPPFHSTMGKFAKFRVLVMEKAYKTSGAGDQHLASVDVNDGFINAALAKESWSMDSREKAAVLLGSKSAILRVPQSLLKLYTFVERWRDENLPRYDSLISEMIKQLDAPVADSQNSLADRYVPPWDKRDFRFQLSLRSIGVQVDLLSNLRISYDVLDLLAFMDTTLLKPAAKGVAKPRLDFACRIGRQEFHFQTRSKGDPAARFGNQVAGTQSTGFSLPSIGGFCVVTFPDGPTPAIADTGALSVDSYIVVDALNAPISVSMIDHFLTAQSVVGNEINDLLDTLVLARRRAVRERAAGEAVRTSDKSKARDPSLFALKVVFERTRIEASSPSAALVVGADTLEGFVTNRGGELHAVRTTAQPVTSHHFYWKFAANGLSLDVMQHLPHDSLGAEATESTEHQHNTAKLATIASDLSVSNIRDSSSNSRYSQEQHTVGLDEFYVGFRRLHVIMQPSALGKILDFGIFYSMELERRQMQRTADLEKLKESTTLFLKSIDVDLPKTATTSTSLFRNKLIFLEINKIAAVIPLEETERGAAHIPSPGKPLTRKPGVKAFMASIHVLTLTTSRLDVNRGALQEICLQFIHDFDQGNERHFNPAAHTGSANRNRLRIPEISGDVTIVNNVTDRKFRASGAVSGFDAELDSSISRYVNSMVSVWRSGRDRMLQVLPPSNPTTKPQASSGSGVDTGTPIRPNPVAAAGPVVLDIQATFQFRKGGSIRIFSKTKRQSGSKVHSAKPSVGTTRSASHSIRKDPESGNPDQQIHLVTIPGLQLSLRSKTLLGSAGGSSEPAKGLQDKDLRRMHVELLIEKSENTFFPSIITFFNEIITNVTTGDGKSTPLNLMPGGSGGSRLVRASKASETGRVQRTTSGNDVSKSSGLDALSRLREDHHTISVYFRLDSTKIELSCQPVSRVTCAFEIERSNVLLFLNRDSHLDLSASATARIGNLSCRVRHAYSSEDSFKGTVGSVSLNAAMVPKPGAFEYAFQLLVPSITGATNFRHLQDIFFLQSCWIPSSDNGLVVAEAIPARSSAGNTVEPSSSSTSQLSTVPQHIRRQSRVIGSLASLSSGSGPSLRNLEGSSVSLSGSNRSLDAVGADSSSSDSSGPAPIIIVSLIAKIGSIDLSAELGHAIGTTSVIWKGSLIDWKRTDRLGRLPKIAGQLSVSSISMQSVGRLAGLTELQNLRVEVDSADPVGSGSGSPRDLARIVEDLFCVLGVETIRGNFEYQFERILLLDIGLLHGSIARGWTSKDGILDCLVRIGARLDSLRAITSRRTLPTILHLARKISSIIEEKRAYVSSKVAIPGHAVATAKQDTSFGFMGAMQGVAKTRKEIDVYEKVYPVAGQSGSLRGQVTIIITAAAITFFRYNFRDTDSALANLKGLELTLNTRRLEDDRTNHPQVTTTKVGSLQVLKTTGRPITAAEERTWTSEQWFQHIGTFRSAPVLVMPTFTMVLQSLTRCARKLVEYSFNADFAGSVDVALNFALYKYLIELANLYLKALRSSDLNVEAGSRAESSGPGLQSASTSVASLPRPSLISAGSSEALVIPGGSDAGSARGGSDNSSDIGEHVGQQVLPAASISSPIPVIIAPDGDGGRSESGMKFVVVGPVRFEPQLRVMGDATPAEWLEYLGVTKEKVPRVVYSIVTENFELLFAGGCSVAALLSRSADDVAPMLRRASTF